MKSNTIKNKPTCRGFGRGEFTDTYGQSCSIQESSGGINIWLGVYNKDMRFQILAHGSEAQSKFGFGWQEKSLKEMYPECDISIPDRMHLSKKHARKLIPLLQNFVKTGWVFPPRVRKPRAKVKPFGVEIGFND